MNRRDFIRSMLAAGVAIAAAPLMPAPASKLRDLVNAGMQFQGQIRVSYPIVRSFHLYGAPLHTPYASLGPWYRPPNQ